MEFNLEPLLNDNRLVVHCPDRDIAIAFVRYIKKCYPNRYFLGSPGESEYWDRNGKTTCYMPKLQSGPNIQYSSYGFYENAGYQIISICDLITPIDKGPFCAPEVDIKSLFGME